MASSPTAATDKTEVLVEVKLKKGEEVRYIGYASAAANYDMLVTTAPIRCPASEISSPHSATGAP